MTFIVYNPTTHSILYRSSLRAANENDTMESPIPLHDRQREIAQRWHDGFPNIGEFGLVMPILK